MSFSSDVKKELTQLSVSDGVLIALLRMNGVLGISGGLTLAITTENATTARFIYATLLAKYEIKSEIKTHQNRELPNRSSPFGVSGINYSLASM